MTLRQLRYLCEIARRDLNISAAAKALHTSQPGISKQIRLLEDELGVRVFVRKAGRIVSVTKPGAQIIDAANLVVRQSENLAQIARDFVEQDAGPLKVAATYTLARYALPTVFNKFTARFPKVDLALHQGNPSEVTKMVASGEVDLGLTTRAAESYGNLVLIEYAKLPRVLVTPAQHPLQKRRRPSLRDLAKYPLIVPHVGSLGQETMQKVFADSGLKAAIRMTATNVDLAKALVENGLGVAVLPNLAFDRKRDFPLRAVEIDHLFGPHTAYLVLREHHYLRAYAYAFIAMFAPTLSRAKLEASIFRRG